MGIGGGLALNGRREGLEGLLGDGFWESSCMGATDI